MGTLFVVATPIGNLTDITHRALEILRKLPYIVCEDTRRCGKLISHFHLGQKTLISFYEGNELQRIGGILNILKNGCDVALVSDAGTPSISDPGFRLVRACVEEGIAVTSIPGPSAVTSALVVSGLPTDTFLFIGYLPKKPGHRRMFLEQVKNVITIEKKIHPTVVLFEAPHKLLTTLGELKEVFGDIPVVLCRELTKVHEQVRREKISASLAHFQEVAPKGEFVVLFNLVLLKR